MNTIYLPDTGLNVGDTVINKADMVSSCQELTCWWKRQPACSEFHPTGHGLVNAVRRDEIPGSEIKDSLLLIVTEVIVAREPAFMCKVSKPQFLQGEREESQMIPAYAGGECSCLGV